MYVLHQLHDPDVMKLQRTKQNSKNGKNSFVGNGGLEPSQAAIHSVPPTSSRIGGLRGRIFLVVKENVRVGGTVATRHGNSPFGGGGGGVICGLILFDNRSSDWAQIQHEDGQCHCLVFLSYFYKICLTLTGNL
jgi:hypothetical protein